MDIPSGHLAIAEIPPPPPGTARVPVRECVRVWTARTRALDPNDEELALLQRAMIVVEAADSVLESVV